MKKKGFLIYILVFGLFFLPKTVFASNSWNGTASVGRSAVLDTSNNYYYTDWKLLSSNSLNIIPVPYSGGQYYHMGAEYSFPFTAMGDTTYVAQFRVPVVSNTIYNYTLMNGLNQSDVKVGIDKDFSVYNVNWAVDNINWECSTYPSLGVAHNYCYYDVKVHFTITDPLYGAYNLNFAVLNTTASRSSYYYDGYDSQGCAIEFPNAASGSGYPLMSPSVILNGYSSGGGGNTDTDEITDSIDSASQDIQDAIQESYENLVNSQQVCQSIFIDKNSIYENGFFEVNGTINNNYDDYYGITDYYDLSFITDIKVVLSGASNASRYCFYDNSKSLIGSCLTSYNLTENSSLSIPNNSKYVRFTIQKNTNRPQFDISFCKNGNQALNDNMMSDSHESPNDFLNGIESLLLSDTPITDLLTLPVRIVQAFITGINGQCSTINLGTWFDTPMYIPCIDIESYIGSTLWNIIDWLFSGFMIYNIFELMLHDYSSLTSLEDLFEETYTPRHTGNSRVSRGQNRGDY